MQRELTVERLERIATTALLGGYGRVLSHPDHVRDLAGRPVRPHDRAGQVRRLVELRCSMDCEEPKTVELFARDSAYHNRTVKPLTVVIFSRCRKCTACKERRRMFWSARAVAEYQSAVRTIFGTLTISPENDAIIDATARLEQAAMGTDFDRLDEAAKFRVRCAVGGREITKFIKRLRGSRPGDTPQFRYLLVAEAHNGSTTSELKRGRPHWHCLIHETDASALLVLGGEWAKGKNGAPISDKYGNPSVADTAFLKRQWKLGFSSFALCQTPQAAAYVCKYLTKEDAQVRIRASGGYGGGRDQDRASRARTPEDKGLSEKKETRPPP